MHLSDRKSPPTLISPHFRIIVCSATTAEMERGRAGKVNACRFPAKAGAPLPAGCTGSAASRHRSTLSHRRPRGRDDAGHDHRRAVQIIRYTRSDLVLPVVALINRLVLRFALGLAFEAA